MIVFYITCAMTGLMVIGTIISNIHEDIVARQPHTPRQQTADESWKTYQSRW
jgi:hypothetical protein